MAFGPGLRKAVLAAHIATSVGWMGAAAAFLVLDVATVAADRIALVRAAYIGMDLLARWAIVPLALAAFVSGLAIALGTPWGLFRHYWVVVSLALTAVAVAVLLVQLPTLAHWAAVAADPAASDTEVRSHGNLLLHSAGGTALLLAITALNVYKPRGLTPRGWRLQQRT